MRKHSRQINCRKIEYWCADAEMKDRKPDIRYMKKSFPQTRFKLVRNAGHGGLAPFQPERLARGIRRDYLVDKRNESI